MSFEKIDFDLVLGLILNINEEYPLKNATLLFNNCLADGDIVEFVIAGPAKTTLRIKYPANFKILKGSFYFLIDKSNSDHYYAVREIKSWKS